MFFIRPQQNEQKNNKIFIDQLKPGDDLILISGLCCKFAHFNNDNIVVSTDDGVKLEFLKQSIMVDSSRKLAESKRNKKA